jgi:hypothetical protein
MNETLKKLAEDCWISQILRWPDGSLIHALVCVPDDGVAYALVKEGFLGQVRLYFLSRPPTRIICFSQRDLRKLYRFAHDSAAMFQLEVMDSGQQLWIYDESI